jgi:hypothetical protein
MGTNQTGNILTSEDSILHSYSNVYSLTLGIVLAIISQYWPTKYGAISPGLALKPIQGD